MGLPLVVSYLFGSSWQREPHRWGRGEINKLVAPAVLYWDLSAVRVQLGFGRRGSEGMFCRGNWMPLFHKSPWPERVRAAGTLQNFAFVFVCLLLFQLTKQVVGTRGPRPGTQEASGHPSSTQPSELRGWGLQPGSLSLRQAPHRWLSRSLHPVIQEVWVAPFPCGTLPSPTHPDDPTPTPKQRPPHDDLLV